MSFEKFSAEQINATLKNTMPEHMGMEFTEFGKDYFKAKMKVTERTVQPMRILHGGASVAFAETMGSVGGFMALADHNTHYIVGLEINANHISGVPEGQWIFGECRPLHIGRSTMVFQIKIIAESGKTVCISRITLAVIERKK